MGAQHGDLLHGCAEHTGWELRLNPEPNQNEIKGCVRRMLPPTWQLQREPSFFKEQNLVRVRLGSPPQDTPTWDAFCAKVKEATGYQVELG